MSPLLSLIPEPLAGGNEVQTRHPDDALTQRAEEAVQILEGIVCQLLPCALPDPDSWTVGQRNILKEDSPEISLLSRGKLIPVPLTGGDEVQTMPP